MAWAEGRTRFHRDAVHDDLRAHEARFLGDAPRHVLVPLCGKTLDMPYLVERGHRVTGVELVPRAVEAFWDDRQLEPERDRIGPYERSRAGAVEILCGDVLDLDPGPYERVWDRAALVALAPDVRPRYAATLCRAMAGGGLILLNAFTYDRSRMDGPPYSVPEDEVRALYEGCDIDKLDERDAIDLVQFEGHEYWLVTTYLIQVQRR
jgi:thiopurine S-methyltransferase